MQDPSLKVRREYIQVSTEPFNLPKPGSAEALATLETPSGKPYQCVPLEPVQNVTGSFAGFNYPAKSAKADPAVVSFMIGFRDNGEDFGGSLTCGYAASADLKCTVRPYFVALHDCALRISPVTSYSGVKKYCKAVVY